MASDLIISRLDRAKLLLAEAKDANGAKKVADMAHAAEIYAKRQRLSQDSIDYAHAVKIDALTLLGDFLKSNPLQQGARGIGKSGCTKGITTLKDSGVGYRDSRISQQLTAIKRQQPSLYESVRSNKCRVSKAITLLRRNSKSEQLHKEANKLSKQAKQSLDSVCDIRHCSMQELFGSGIKPDLIITDPPYPREFLPLYAELAKLSIHVPMVAVMVGHSYLPEIINLMSPPLKYRWILAYLTPGGQSAQQWQAKINTFWKPILLFGKSTDWIGDVCKSNANDNDKDHHHWGQSESGMNDLVSRLALPGQLVCDPFLGAGTTAICALKHHCRFVGCDIDAESVKVSKSRTAVLFNELHS